MTQAVVFDLGGVLFNWQPPVLLQSLLPHRVRDEAEAQPGRKRCSSRLCRDQIGLNLIGACSARIRCGTALPLRTGLPAHELKLVMEAIPNHLAPVLPTVRWLEQLARAGVPLYYLSNMPQPYAAYLRAAHPFLALFRVGYFHAMCTRSNPTPTFSKPRRGC